MPRFPLNLFARLQKSGARASPIILEIMFHTYTHTYIIYLFTQVEKRQHKADVDLRLIKFTNLKPINKPSKT